MCNVSSLSKEGLGVPCNEDSVPLKAFTSIKGAVMRNKHEYKYFVISWTESGNTENNSSPNEDLAHSHVIPNLTLMSI